MSIDAGIVTSLTAQRIELPSCAFGDSGTRFKDFAQEDVPRTSYEKVADAAQVHRDTSVAPTVVLHIPWDRVDDYAQLGRHAADCGVTLGTINLEHLLECVDIMDATGSRDLKLWFADGTIHPGQGDIRARQDRPPESLASFYTMDVPDWGWALVHCLALGSQALVVVDTSHHAPGTNIEFIVASLLCAGKLGAFDFNSRFYADAP